VAEESPRFIFSGNLQRDFVILPDGKVLLDVPGGNVLYAAVGLLIWEPDPPPGLLARVGEDYPQDWLQDFKQHGLDTRGVRILPKAIDLRRFYAFSDQDKFTSEDPVAHFARYGLPFPRSLLGYHEMDGDLDSRVRLLPTSIRQDDLIPEYMDAGAAHLCSMDYLTHSLMPAILRQAAFTTVTLDPSSGYMNPTFWGDVPSIVTGLTAFMPSEQDLRMLFQGRSEDLWEMIEAVSAYGCELVVVKRGKRGQLLYEKANGKRWEIPAYAARVSNAQGAGNALCGGFLAGYRRTYDPLEAILYGNVSASLVVEGNLPFYALEALPGLAEARLEAVRQMVRKV
jgi:sugar/nucleoside kinase (ribokinase family)